MRRSTTALVGLAGLVGGAAVSLAVPALAASSPAPAPAAAPAPTSTPDHQARREAACTVATAAFAGIRNDPAAMAKVQAAITQVEERLARGNLPEARKAKLEKVDDRLHRIADGSSPKVCAPAGA